MWKRIHSLKHQEVRWRAEIVLLSLICQLNWCGLDAGMLGCKRRWRRKRECNVLRARTYSYSGWRRIHWLRNTATRRKTPNEHCIQRSEEIQPVIISHNDNYQHRCSLFLRSHLTVQLVMWAGSVTPATKSFLGGPSDSTPPD